MGKKNRQKAQASSLTQSDRELGKNRIYIILGMIIIGLAIAIYRVVLN